MAFEHSRWGFDKMMAKIKSDGRSWNHKRVYRIYRELKLNIRIKPRKRLPSGEAKMLIQPLQRNACWSLDFMSDALRYGRRFRTLNVIDDYNREALLIEPGFSLPANKVIALLNQLILKQGHPEMIRVDNGPELTSQPFRDWAKLHNILIHYIQPGKPAQNAYIERFNRTYRNEVLDAYWFDDLQEVKRVTEMWRIKYNNERPHESLGNQSPVRFALNRTTRMVASKIAMLNKQHLEKISTFNLS